MTPRPAATWLDKPLEMLTADDVAAYLHVNVRTVRRSNIPHIKLGERRLLRYQVRDVLAWIEEQKLKPEWAA